MLKDQLVGSFRLVSLETRRVDGRVDRPMGDAPTGLFMFGPDGHYSVQLGPDQATDGAVMPYVAMWGTYSVDEQARTFTLTPDGALDPMLIGATIVRRVDFRDGVAVFNTPPQLVDGAEATTYITWRRV